MPRVVRQLFGAKTNVPQPPETSPTMSEPVFMLALTIAATTLVLVAKAIAGAIAGRGASRSEIAQITQRLDQDAAALEDAQTTLANQSTQLAELQERLDFAERLLAQARARPALGTEEKL
jgi:exonuclease VII small subunit